MPTPCPDWNGRTVVCIGSGPSLTEADCELVRKSGHPVAVTNTTFRLCPWADAVVGFDARWWRMYGAEVTAEYRVTASSLALRYGANVWHRASRNSGALAAYWAMNCEAEKIVLLGYDAGFHDGKKHHHGDHPEGLENCNSIAEWPQQFAALARYAKRREVVILNASRMTALECFPRVDLGSAL